MSLTHARKPRVLNHLKRTRRCCFSTREKNEEKHSHTREKNLLTGKNRFKRAASNGEYSFDTIFFR